MGVRVIQSNDRAAMFCSTSGVCFGPAIWASSEDAANAFVAFAAWTLHVDDVRSASEEDLFRASLVWANLSMGDECWHWRECDADDFETCPKARLGRLRMRVEKGEA